jgi:hypothetical protein
MHNTRRINNKQKQNIIKEINEYAPGTCYGCQICLHCRENRCDCDKTIKPKIFMGKRKKRVAFSREFSLDSLNNICLDYLYEKNQCFNYGIDFSSKFSAYFCTKCHSKFCRITSKKPTQIPKALSPSSSKELSISSSPKTSTPVLLSPSSVPSTPKRVLSSPFRTSSTPSKTAPSQSPKRVSLSPFEASSQSPVSSSPISDDEHPLDLKFKLSIKKADNSFLPQKWLNVKLTSHFDFTYDIEIQVKKLLNLSRLNENDYSLSYQALHTRGLGTQLFDNNDWKEFLNDVKQMIKNNKTLLVNVSMIEKKRSEGDQKKKRRKNGRYIYIIFNYFMKFYYIIINILFVVMRNLIQEKIKDQF